MIFFVNHWLSAISWTYLLISDRFLKGESLKCALFYNAAGHDFKSFR